MLLPLVKQPKINNFLSNQYGKHRGIHAKTQEPSKCLQLLSDLCIVFLLRVGNIDGAIQALFGLSCSCGRWLCAGLNLI